MSDPAMSPSPPASIASSLLEEPQLGDKTGRSQIAQGLLLAFIKLNLMTGGAIQ